MTELRTFCSQLVAFFEDLSETYPEENEIVRAAQTINLMKQANPRMVYSIFMKNVYSEFSEHILNEDEEYILGRTKQLVQSDPTNLNVAFWIFDKHWSTMSETNKQYVWKYIKSLIILAGRVP